MITMQEVEMLAVLLQRAGVNRYESAWANMILDKLRAIATQQEAERALPRGAVEENGPESDKVPE